MTREYTNKILEAVDEGLLDARTILRDALCYMSEDDVKAFADAGGFFDDEGDGGFFDDEGDGEEFEFSDEAEVADAFVEHWSDLLLNCETAEQMRALEQDEPAKRLEFAVFIDGLQRDGRISDELANTVTMGGDE